MTPGIHDVDATTYHRLRAASASGLRVIHARTPAHLRKTWDDQDKPSLALVLGTLIHGLVLEPHMPLPRIALVPETYTVPADSKPDKGAPGPGETVPWNNRAKHCRDWRALQEAAGKIVLDAEDMATVRECAQAVEGNDEAAELLRRCIHRESTLVWETEARTPCKARLDAWGEDALVVDVKTTTDASPDGFRRHAYDLGYHLQAAWYVDGLATVLGCEPPAFYFVAVEKDTRLVTVHHATHDFLQRGREAYGRALSQFEAAWESGVWPGYAPGIHDLDVPEWVARKGGA
jgi:exodeoxyribonuclease VIII